VIHISLPAINQSGAAHAWINSFTQWSVIPGMHSSYITWFVTTISAGSDDVHKLTNSGYQGRGLILGICCVANTFHVDFTIKFLLEGQLYAVLCSTLVQFLGIVYWHMQLLLLSPLSTNRWRGSGVNDHNGSIVDQLCTCTPFFSASVLIIRLNSTSHAATACDWGVMSAVYAFLLKQNSLDSG
jgi:hypothetical protein